MADDVLLHLHPRQSDAFTSEATEILYGGAAGGGKSHLMRVAAIAWCFAIPGLQVYLFRRVSNDLNKNHMEGPSSFPILLSPWVESKQVKINYSDSTIEFLWNKSKIFLCHCQHEKDMYKYQGAEIHLLLIDELTHFSEKIYTYLRGRVRMAGINLPSEHVGKFPRIICGSNPGGVGHNWVKQTFIDGAIPLEIRNMPNTSGGMKRQYIPAKISDNPSLEKDDPAYINRLDGLSDQALVKAMKDGDWNIVSGGFFDDLWKEEKHVIKPFKIPSHWYCFRSFDWGSSKPFSCGWWAESDGTEAPDGRFYPRGSLIRFSEWYGCQEGKYNEGLKMTSKEVAQGIKERDQLFEKEYGVKISDGVADPAIFSSNDGPSIAENMESFGIYWEKADNARLTGWEQLRERLKGEGGDPTIYFFDICLDSVRTLPVAPRDAKKPDDIDTEYEDHAIDEIRYACMSRKKTVFAGKRY